jgi:uncharacterized protein YndB with AHSA1/START domain
MSYDFTLTSFIPATPQAIYDAWLDSRGHSEMTGGKATASNAVGGAFTAWDGFISGENLELTPYSRIVQSWRTTRFTGKDQDSRITLTLTPAKGGTELKLEHCKVPDGHTGYRDGGWETHYFEPMKKYFAARAG